MLSNSRQLIEARRAQNTRAVTFVAALLAALALLAIRSPSTAPVVFGAVLGNAIACAFAYLSARKGHTSFGAVLMIGSALVEQIVIATQPEATLVIPFFAPVFVLVGAACLPESRLIGISFLALLTIGTEYLLAPPELPRLSVYSTFVAATILLFMTSVVAWLSLVGLERAFARAQQAEATQQELLLKLEKSSRLEALGRLASGVAHDFNNFLLVIRTSTELARSRLPSDADTQTELAQVEQATDRATDLTRQLLEFGKRQQAPLARIRIGQVIAELLPLLERLVGPKISLVLELPANENMVLATRTQIEQILINLVTNARDAMPSDGRIEIELSEETLGSQQAESLPAGSYAKLRVSDRGQGIPSENLSRLFEPLFTTKGEGRGSGLGLATCASIAERLGGAITVESSVGEGTTFHVFLPLAADSGRPWKPVRASMVHPRHVLVFDSDPHARDLITRLLAGKGDEIQSRESLADCIQEAEFGGPFDLIIVDGGPQTGALLSTLDRLHQLQPNALIVVTSGSPPGEAVLTNTREHVYLPKPFSPAELLSATQTGGASV